MPVIHVHNINRIERPKRRPKRKRNKKKGKVNETEIKRLENLILKNKEDEERRAYFTSGAKEEAEKSRLLRQNAYNANIKQTPVINKEVVTKHNIIKPLENRRYYEEPVIKSEVVTKHNTIKKLENRRQYEEPITVQPEIVFDIEKAREEAANRYLETQRAKKHLENQRMRQSGLKNIIREEKKENNLNDIIDKIANNEVINILQENKKEETTVEDELAKLEERELEERIEKLKKPNKTQEEIDDELEEERESEIAYNKYILGLVNEGLYDEADKEIKIEEIIEEDVENLIEEQKRIFNDEEIKNAELQIQKNNDIIKELEEKRSLRKDEEKRLEDAKKNLRREELRKKTLISDIHKFLIKDKKQLVKDRKKSVEINDQALENIERYQEFIPLIERLGKGNSEDKGMYDNEIDQVMKHDKNFQGAICSDEMWKIQPRDKLSFIMNTGSSKSKGFHWFAVYIDSKDKKEVDVFNSLGDPPTKEFMKDIKQLIDKIDPDTYLKFKWNSIPWQKDNTSTCGWQSINFLNKMNKGETFTEATGYKKLNIDKTDEGEKESNKLKKKNGFGYI